MNIPTISAQNTAPSSSATGAKGSSDTTSGGSDGSFSKVLTHQQEIESGRAKASSPTSQSPSAKSTTAASGKAADRKLATENSFEEDDALALAANDQALGLPQLAIQIAAQAAAVQSADAKSQPLTESAGKTSRSAHSLAAALAAGNQAAKAPVLPAQANPITDTLVPATDRGTLDNTGKDFLKQADAMLSQTPEKNDTASSKKLAKPTLDATQPLTPSQLREQGKLKITASDFPGAQANATHGSKIEPATQMTPVDTISASQAAALTASAATASFVGGNQPAATGMINMLSTGAQTALTDIAQPLQSPQWASDFGRQFMSMAQGSHTMPHTAELRLDPPELGPLRITINISDNIAHAIFVSPHAAVRQTVENALPQLQQLLAQAGISLGQTSVNDQGQPGQSFNESANGQGGARSATGVPQAGSIGRTGDIAAMPAARTLAPNALVDTFA